MRTLITLNKNFMVVAWVLLETAGLSVEEAHRQPGLVSFDIIDGEDLVAQIHYSDTIEVDLQEYTLKAEQLDGICKFIDNLKANAMEFGLVIA